MANIEQYDSGRHTHRLELVTEEEEWTGLLNEKNIFWPEDQLENMLKQAKQTQNFRSGNITGVTKFYVMNILTFVASTTTSKPTTTLTPNTTYSAEFL